MFRRPTLLALLLGPLLWGSNALAAPGTVTVRPGDTLYGISKRSGVSVARLRALNGLKGSTIQPGQKLRLSGAAPATKAVVPKPPAARSPSVQSIPARPVTAHYTVRPGDTLGRIAARAGVSVAALRAANGLSGSLIKPGQRLRVPPRGTVAVAARPPAPARPRTEVRVVYGYVRAGPRDTLASLARKYHTTAAGLARLNHMNVRARPYVGQRVLVPRRVPVPIPPAPRSQPVSVKRFAPLGIPVRVLRVDLRHRNVLVAPVLPRAGLSAGARVGTLARTSGARAVVNGSYFHPRSYVPAGDLVMQGRLLAWGRIPAALAITPDNRATITTSTTPLLGRPLEASWRGMETVIATGPRILSSGRVVTRYGNVFRDPALFGRAARSAVGLGSSRDLVFVTTHARLTTTEMGKVMARLGVRDALLLDGGSSAGLAWNGKAVLDSVRKVAYGIGVFTDYTGRRYAR
ncbi:LysM peptidoglycan-binding domain-containing protein [Deinococcus planocerae]|uniref:LysM peptidoglycan-binding domain-containing protein n=1 Tax=Deinococcus planocerae TaxID=1737569 RepID=UPI000C7F64B8|nr:LysM peptidoglycan-binding domain-containing protein [Deinococcus planocerae]